jgi:hypothetical protein
VFASNQYFEQIMLNRQLQMEMELESLRIAATQGNTFRADGPLESMTQQPTHALLPPIRLNSENETPAPAPLVPEVSEGIHQPGPLSVATVEGSKELANDVQHPIDPPVQHAAEPPKDGSQVKQHHHRVKGGKAKHKKGSSQPPGTNDSEPVSRAPTSDSGAQSTLDGVNALEAVPLAATAQVSSTQSVARPVESTVTFKAEQESRVPSASAPEVFRAPPSVVSTPFSHPSQHSHGMSSAPPSVASATSVGFGPLSAGSAYAQQQRSAAAVAPGMMMQRNLYSPWPVGAPNPAMIYSPPVHINPHAPQHGSQHHYSAEQSYAPRGGPASGAPGQYNMFVLSAAPKLSFENMLAQDMSYSQQLNQPSFASHFSQMPTHAMHSPGSPGSLSMSMDNSMMSDDLTARSMPRPERTIQDQIHRFAEIRSLFQMPSHADGGPFHPSSGSSAGRGYYPRDQTNLMDELAHSKLQESIDRHKDRLLRSRQPRSRPAPQSSPRLRIHKAHRPLNNNGSQAECYPAAMQGKPHTTGQMLSAQPPQHMQDANARYHHPASSTAPTGAASIPPQFTNGLGQEAPHLVTPHHMSSPPMTSVSVSDTAPGDAMFRIPTGQTETAAREATADIGADARLAAVDAERLVPGGTMERELSIEEFEKAVSR